MLQEIEPRIPFKELVLLDPAILPPGRAAVMNNLFGNYAKSKKDTWPSREAAYQELAKHPAYRRWDPPLVESFAVCVPHLPFGHWKSN